MPTLATVRPRCFLKRAPLALALTLAALAAAPASAQSVGWPQSYSLRWYGQNFYDHQHNGFFARHGERRQYNSGYYGPATIYSRQYSDESGLTRTRPFAQSRPVGSEESGGYAQIR